MINRSGKSNLLKNSKLLYKYSLICSQWPLIDKTDINAIASYLKKRNPLSIAKSEGVILDLEQKFNQELNLHRLYSLSFNSGTNALYAAFAACGIKPGTSVIAAGYTFHATVTPAIALGAKVHLLDSDRKSGNVTLTIVKEALNKNPQSAVVVINHNWGIPVEDIAEIVKHSHSRGLKVIEDCSHAHGATIDGRATGTFGDISIFSLQAKKLIVAGEGGIALTDNPNLYVAMKAQGHYRRMESPFLQNSETAEFEKYIETGVGGLKFRLPALSAVMALSQLKKFHKVLDVRRQYVATLQKSLEHVNWLKFPEYDKNRSNPSWYNIRLKYIPSKNNNIGVAEVVEAMQKRGLDVHLGTSSPLTELLIFQENPKSYSLKNTFRPLYKAGDLPNASSFCENTIVFPVFSKNDRLTTQVIQAYANIVGNLYKS